MAKKASVLKDEVAAAIAQVKKSESVVEGDDNIVLLTVLEDVFDFLVEILDTIF